MAWPEPVLTRALAWRAIARMVNCDGANTNVIGAERVNKLFIGGTNFGVGVLEVLRMSGCGEERQIS